MALLYGVNLDGVRSFLPHRPIDVDTEPSADQVTAWLDEIGARVAAKVGDLALIPDEKADVRDRLELLARGVVHMGVASLTEAAGAPESAGDASAYSTWLWERYASGLEELDAQVQRLTDSGELELGEVVEQLPAYSFPPPVGWQTIGW